MSNKITADSSISVLKGVGAALITKLGKIGITTLHDRIRHFPSDYQDRTKLTSIKSVHLGKSFVFEGVITRASVERKHKKSLACIIQDQTSEICLRFYYFSELQRKQLKVGVYIRCYGEPRNGSSGLEIYHPEYTILNPEKIKPLEKTLTPVYPVTQGISQYQIRKLCKEVLVLLDSLKIIQDFLPVSLKHSIGLWGLLDSIHYLHSPPVGADIEKLAQGTHPSQQRICFDELLAHHLSMSERRKKIQSIQTVPLEKRGKFYNKFSSSLGFELTQSQQKVIEEISNDLIRATPMSRLLQGDVGSGKTVVMAMAALQAIENDCQVLLMTPTEILSEQHFNTFNNWFEPLGLKVSLLTGKTSIRNKKIVAEEAVKGKVQMIIGTHALFHEGIHFKSVGLMIIDEQHRFGVHQRMSLWNKGIKKTDTHEKEKKIPHQLIVTATPIPRTLTMTFLADLDCSIIDELPVGRKPVQTVVVNSDKRNHLISRVKEACLKGKQCYWVCTLIDESDTINGKAAESIYKELCGALPDLNISIVHGKMKSKEKNAQMKKFKEDKIHILVATTVIEVGVDVPNASLMIIENADRLGLSQLHQLRGRVGRGDVKSYCVLMHQSNLSEDSRKRLKAMKNSSNGFVISEKDLEIRGPGEILGTKQTGNINFKVSDIKRDKQLLRLVYNASSYMQSKESEVIEPFIKQWIQCDENYLCI